MNSRATPLSQTASGRLWLQNFELDEVADAAALLDAIANVSETTFRTDMKWVLKGVREANPHSTIAVFALRGIPTALRESSGFTDMSLIPRGTGSELIVENILAKTSQALDFLFEPNVEEMRERRVDIILFVTDTVASGTEASRFMTYFASNSSIRSWLSSKHVRFELAAHTVSDFGWHFLDRDRRLSSVHLMQPGADFDSAGWSKEKQERIHALCEKYSDGRSNSLGFAGVSHLTIFGHTVGNGLPRILLQKTGPGPRKWIPLLTYDRGYGLDEDEEAENADHVPAVTPETTVETLRNANSSRLVQKQESAAIQASSGDVMSPVILLLVCLRLGIVTEFQLMRYAKMTRRRLAAIVQYCEEMGLITVRKELTPSGRKLIRKFGLQSNKIASSVLRHMTDPYYPSQLR